MNGPDPNQRRLVLVAAAAGIASFIMTLAAADLLTHDGNSAKKRLEKKKLEQAGRAIMANLYTFHATPTEPIPYRNRFGLLMVDPHRDYVKSFTSLYSWEILELVEKLRPAISEARETSWRPTPVGKMYDANGQLKKKRGRPPKYDETDRLIFTLEFLREGAALKKMVRQLFAPPSLLSPY